MLRTKYRRLPYIEISYRSSRGIGHTLSLPSRPLWLSLPSTNLRIAPRSGYREGASPISSGCHLVQNGDICSIHSRQVQSIAQQPFRSVLMPSGFHFAFLQGFFHLNGPPGVSGVPALSSFGCSLYLWRTSRIQRRHTCSGMQIMIFDMLSVRRDPHLPSLPSSSESFQPSVGSF